MRQKFLFLSFGFVTHFRRFSLWIKCIFPAISSNFVFWFFRIYHLLLNQFRRIQHFHHHAGCLCSPSLHFFGLTSPSMMSKLLPDERLKSYPEDAQCSSTTHGALQCQIQRSPTRERVKSHRSFTPVLNPPPNPAVPAGTR